jgi:hypothetical protein
MHGKGGQVDMDSSGNSAKNPCRKDLVVTSQDDHHLCVADVIGFHGVSFWMITVWPAGLMGNVVLSDLNIREKGLFMVFSVYEVVLGKLRSMVSWNYSSSSLHRKFVFKIGTRNTSNTAERNK